MTSTQANSEEALLYRTYWKLVLGDILHGLGHDATKDNKVILHDFHKRILQYKTIAGLPYERLSKFILEVTIFWGERGLFVRTKANQPLDMTDRALKDMWKYL